MTTQNLANKQYNVSPIATINTGTYDMDATGSWLFNAFTITNANFTSVFAPLGLTPQLVTIGTENLGQGDTLYAAFTKINANFAVLQGVYTTIPFQLINVGSGAYNGVIGLGDPGKLAFQKINTNFGYV